MGNAGLQPGAFTLQSDPDPQRSLTPCAADCRGYRSRPAGGAPAEPAFLPSRAYHWVVPERLAADPAIRSLCQWLEEEGGRATAEMG